GALSSLIMTNFNSQINTVARKRRNAPGALEYTRGEKSGFTYNKLEGYLVAFVALFIEDSV
ncbi:MAG TPA: hypothetical protein VNZ25_01015, partial [Candidatus Angelobacter sp.]|nr:hypothetical protein [Candidatus Angelobacter sp.]